MMKTTAAMRNRVVLFGCSRLIRVRSVAGSVLFTRRLSVENNRSDEKQIHEKMRLAIVEGILKKNKGLSMDINDPVQRMTDDNNSSGIRRVVEAIPPPSQPTYSFRAILTSLNEASKNQGNLWDHLKPETLFLSLESVPLDPLFLSLLETELFQLFQHFERFHINRSHPIQLHSFLSVYLSQSACTNLLSDDMKLKLLRFFVHSLDYDVSSNQAIVQQYLLSIPANSFTNQLSNLQSYIATLSLGNITWKQLPFETQKAILTSLLSLTAEPRQIEYIQLVDLAKSFQAINVRFQSSHRALLDGYVSLLKELVRRDVVLSDNQMGQPLLSLVIPQISSDEILRKRFSNSDRSMIVTAFQKQIMRCPVVDILGNLNYVASSFIDPAIIRRLIQNDLPDRIIQCLNTASMIQITGFINVLTTVKMSWEEVPGSVREKVTLRLSDCLHEPIPSDRKRAEAEASNLQSLLSSLSRSSNPMYISRIYYFQSRLFSRIEQFLPYFQDFAVIQDILESLSAIGVQIPDFSKDFLNNLFSLFQEKSKTYFVSKSKDTMKHSIPLNQDIMKEIESLRELIGFIIRLEKLGFDYLHAEEDHPALWQCLRELTDDMIKIRYFLHKEALQTDFAQYIFEERLTSPFLQTLILESVEKLEVESRQVQSSNKDDLSLIPAALDYLVACGFSLTPSAEDADRQSLVYGHMQHYLRSVEYQAKDFAFMMKLINAAKGEWEDIPSEFQKEIEKNYLEMIESESIRFVELMELTNRLVRLGKPRISSPPLQNRLFSLILPRNEDPSPEEAIQLGNRLHWLRYQDYRWFNLSLDAQEGTFRALSVLRRSSHLTPERYLQILSEIVKMDANISNLSVSARTAIEIGLITIDQQLQRDTGSQEKTYAHQTKKSNRSRHPYALMTLQRFNQLEYSWSTFSPAAQRAILSMIRRDLQSLNYQGIVKLLHSICLLSFDCQPKLSPPSSFPRSTTSTTITTATDVSIAFHETHRAIFRQWWSRSQKLKQFGKDAQEQYMISIYYYWFPMLPLSIQRYLSSLDSISRTPNPILAMNSMRNKWQQYLNRIFFSEEISIPIVDVEVATFLTRIEDGVRSRLGPYLTEKAPKKKNIYSSVLPMLTFQHHSSPFSISKLFPVTLIVKCNEDYLAFIEILEDQSDLFYQSGSDQSGYLKRQRVLQKEIFRHYFPQASFHYLPITEVSNRSELVETSIVDELLIEIGQRLHPSQG